jgi:hypothetical protein
MAHEFSEQISYLGRTTFRNGGRFFGIKQPDRFSHMYIVGQTGTGKTTLLESLIRQDIAAGRGLALLDPHGDLVERVHAAVPKHRLDSVVYLNVPDPKQPYGYNPLRRVRMDRIPLAASGLLEAMKKQWSDAWGVRMEHVLRNALYALLEYGEATLADVLRLLSDRGYRQKVAWGLANDPVRRFWLNEYENYSFRYRADAIAPIQNKVGAFLADPTLNRILTSPERDIRIRKLMDEGGILLVNLAKGRLGEDSASLLGSLLVSTIGLAAMSRADMQEEKRRDFFLYIDEFQNFTTLSLATMASELRKYRVGLILAHQHLHQLEPEILHAVVGNVGTVIAFRVGPEDAPFLAREFEPVFDTEDLISLRNHHIYLKLMIDGEPSRAFSAATLDSSVGISDKK